jgi:proteasome lid subunit RPN8/RPN11
MAGTVTLRLSGALLDGLRRAAEQAYPAECCGVLGGRVNEVKEVLRLVPVANRRTDDPHRYLISPDDLRRVTVDLSRTELEVVGFYHSHPDHPAVPSAFDVEHAWPWYSYLIVQVSGGRAAGLASWQLNDDRAAMRPEPLDVFSEV